MFDDDVSCWVALSLTPRLHLVLNWSLYLENVSVSCFNTRCKWGLSRKLVWTGLFSPFSHTTHCFLYLCPLHGFTSLTVTTEPPVSVYSQHSAPYLTNTNLCHVAALLSSAKAGPQLLFSLFVNLLTIFWINLFIIINIRKLWKMPILILCGEQGLDVYKCFVLSKTQQYLIYHDRKARKSNKSTCVRSFNWQIWVIFPFYNLR